MTDLFAYAVGALLGIGGVVLCDLVHRHGRAKANADVRSVEDRWRRVAEIAPDAVFIHVDGRIVFANFAMARLLGATAPERLIGMEANKVLHPEHHEFVRQHCELLVNDAKAIEFRTMRYLKLDGEEVWVEAGATVLPWDGRDGFMVVGRDITARRKAEQALRDSEARYRAVVEDQTELIARYLPDGNLTFVNDAYCRFFGVTPEEVLGRPFKSRVPEADHPEIDALISRLGSGGTFELRDRSVIRADGEVLWIQWTNRAIRDTRGNLMEIQAVGREVTEQRRVAEALEASEARMREIIDLAPVLIFVRDMEGRLLLVNRAVAELYGTTVRALTGRYQRDFHPDLGELERFLESDRKALASGTRLLIPEQTFTDGQGRQRFIETTKIPFATGDGGAQAILTVSQDITERREAEARLHRAQKMEAVGQLTGGIAHDFNNLLAIILGNLQLIERDVDGNSELTELAGAAIDATRRGASLTHQLLAFSRQQTLAPTVLNLNQLIGDTSHLLTRSLGESYTVTQDLDGDLWNTLADPSQVESAILNLVINAGQATPDGGAIVIRTRNTRLDENDVAGLDDVAPGDYVAVSVEDNGHGMTPDVAERAFEPFFTTKQGGGGSGFGLSMVYGFVRQSGGHARIDSTENDGTMVTLYLPRSTAEIEAAMAPARIAAAATDAIVMVVEDDPDVRDIAVKLLGRLGYRVRAAVSGPDALRQFDTDPEVDIVFTDMVLPDGMSGGELAVELRRRREDLPILFTSGNTEIDPQRDTSLSGGYSFLRKPYLAEELASKLRELNLNK